MNRSTYDVVIIGGGIMSSATAYHLKHADAKLDLSCFGAERILENKPLSEKGVV